MSKFQPYNIKMRTTEEESKCERCPMEGMCLVYDGVVPSRGRRAVLGQKYKRR